MNLNLIADAWIPILDRAGRRRTIAPWQMTDADLVAPDWPRPDLNIACLELLIGLVFLADPPADDEEWEARQAPDPDRLRARLAPFAPAFDLLRDGPRFLQELGGLEGEPSPPDMLFIDSAGAQTARNNADLMVRRGRYPSLDLPLAAMALYAFQAHAPSGGAGNRTSMRGGGPMVTLVEPVEDGGGLWSVLWANVPCGRPAAPEHLPWMHRARTSEVGQQVLPHQAHAAEAFFGMPRRLRLIGGDAGVVGVVQKPYGTNYAGWVHPLTPHYRQKPGAELLAVHPRPGHFAYRNWLGVVAAMPDGGLRERASTVAGWPERSGERPARVIVAGWAMDNMKPRDFILSRAPLIDLPGGQAILLAGMIQAAEFYGVALRAALRSVLAEGEAREAAREEFFIQTQDAFEARLQALSAPGDGDGAEVCLATARGWLDDMQTVAMAIFESQALPGLPDRRPEEQKAIVDAHRGLRSAFAGYGKIGRDAWGKLEISPPETKKGRAAA